MGHDLDPIPRPLGYEISSPRMRARLAGVLAAHWDATGALAAALAARPEGPDPTRPRSLDEVARDVAGLLAAGGTEAALSGYLRREEEAVLGPPADDAERQFRGSRRAFVRAALWRAARGLELPGDIPGASTTPPA